MGLGTDAISRLQAIEDRLSALAPRGYSCGYHIRFSRPIRRVTTYASIWLNTYTRRNMIVADPCTIWAMTRDTPLRWSDLARRFADPMAVLTAARDHGASFGVAFGIGAPESRTIFAAAHGHREFTDAEIAEMRDLVRHGHDLIGHGVHLRPILIDALEAIACGMTYEQACGFLRISRTALRYRLAAARLALDAQDNAQAIRKAIDAGLFSAGTPEGIARGLPSAPMDG